MADGEVIGQFLDLSVSQRKHVYLFKIPLQNRSPRQSSSSPIVQSLYPESASRENPRWGPKRLIHSNGLVYHSRHPRSGGYIVLCQRRRRNTQVHSIGRFTLAPKSSNHHSRSSVSSLTPALRAPCTGEWSPLRTQATRRRS